MQKGKDYKVTIVFAIVALMMLTILGVITLSIFGASTRTTPAITTIVGLVVPVIGVLIAIAQTEKTDHKADMINDKVNGHITRLTEAAINAGVKPEDLPPLPPDIAQPEGK